MSRKNTPVFAGEDLVSIEGKIGTWKIHILLFGNKYFYLNPSYVISLMTIVKLVLVYFYIYLVISSRRLLGSDE